MAIWEDLLSEHDRKVLAAIYPRQPMGFGERPALMVIDMNVGAVGEDRPIYEQLDVYPRSCGSFAWSTVRNLKRLLPAVRAAGIPIIYTKQIFKGIDEPLKHLASTYTEVNPQSEIHPEIGPQPGELVIEKERPSAFYNTHLLDVLLSKKIDTLILTGTSASGCVRAHAQDAVFTPGFKVSVVKECIMDRTELSLKAALSTWSSSSVT